MLLLWSATPMQAFNGGENFGGRTIVYNDDTDDLFLFWFMFMRGE
jgi:hypothetical protein